MKRITEPFGKAGLIVAVVALVAALVGGAYAADKHGGSSRKKAHHKKKGPKFVTRPQAIAIAKKFAAEGPAGPQGPKGDMGAAGTNGTNGADGSNGSNGAPGADGKSVVVGSFTGEDEEFGEPAGEPCELQGGTEVEVEGSGEVEYVCNGAEGPEGALGTAGTTLPPGATETGAWAVSGSNAAQVSFTIPLGAPLSEPAGTGGGCYEEAASRTQPCHVDFIGPGGHESNPNTGAEETVAPAHCLGNVAEPQADPGYLCVYAKAVTEAYVFNKLIFDPSAGVGQVGAATGGALVHLYPAGAGASAYGTWAVTEAE